MARVVVLGSSNTDMVVRVPRLPVPGETLLGGSFLTGPGGKGANQAVAARRAGAEVVFLTAVGDDRLGQEALGHYREEGLDVSHVRVVPGCASGVALIFVGDGGENMIGVAPGANARLDPDVIDRLPDSVFIRGDVLLAGLEVPLATVARAILRARAAGLRVILNPAPADRRLFETDLLRAVDILTPNEVEASILASRPVPAGDDVARQAAAELRSRGVGSVIVTQGEEGCLLFEPGGPGDLGQRIPAFATVAVDTVGAGDAFNGALAAALAQGRPLRDAAVWASAAAALAVTRPGAQTALPHRDAIDRLVSEGRVD